MNGLDLKALARAMKRVDTIITPRLNKWLIQHGDEALDDVVADTIMRLLTTPPRERSESFSSSSAGFCPRRQVLGFLGAEGAPVDPQLQNIFNDGKWRHLRWQAMLLMANIIADVEDPLRWPRMRSVGTMDGSGIVPDDHPKPTWRGLEFGFELKGVSGFQFAKYKNDGPKEEHLNQVARYFLMSGFDLFVIVYEDKSTQAWYEWVVEPDKERIEAQREELKCLNESVSSRTLPPMLPGCARQTGEVWRDCPMGGSTGPCVRAGTWPTRDVAGFENSKAIRKYD